MGLGQHLILKIKLRGHGAMAKCPTLVMVEPGKSVMEVIPKAPELTGLADVGKIVIAP
jgi:hypothetical protein